MVVDLTAKKLVPVLSCILNEMEAAGEMCPTIYLRRNRFEPLAPMDSAVTTLDVVLYGRSAVVRQRGLFSVSSEIVTDNVQIRINSETLSWSALTSLNQLRCLAVFR